MPSPRHILEYVVLRCLSSMLNWLPHRGAMALATGVAWLAFHVGRFRVREAVRRIEQVFGDHYTPAERRRIAWRSWRNLVCTVGETLRQARYIPAEIERIVDAGEVAERVAEHAASGRGGVIATAHFGSWELGRMAVQAYGLPAFSLAATQKNPLVDRFFNRMRESHGAEVVMRGDASTVRAIIRRLKAGQYLAVAPDVRAPTKAIRVRFLGAYANVAEGPAAFAWRVGAPILPVFDYRECGHRHRLKMFDPIWPDCDAPRDEEYRRMMQEFFDILDGLIREAPGQWLWFNKRWILDPLAEDTVGAVP